MVGTKPEMERANGPRGTAPEGRANGRRGSRSAVIRRQPTSGWPLWQRRLRRGWSATLALCPLWVVLAFGSATWSLLPKASFFAPRLEVGAIAPRTVVAERELSVADENQTADLEAAARAQVLPVYDFDGGREDRTRAQIEALFVAGRALDTVNEEGPGGGSPVADVDIDEVNVDPSVALSAASGLKITTDQAAAFLDLGMTLDLEERLADEVGRLLRRGLVSEKNLLLEHRVRGITLQILPSGTRRIQLDLFGYLDYPEQVRETLAQDVRLWTGINGPRRRHLVDFLAANLEPNLTPNNSETLALRQRAVAQVGQVTRSFPKGQVIVRKGDQVDEITALALAALAGSRNVADLVRKGLGTVLLIAVVLYGLWLGIRRETPIDRSRERLFSECLLLLSVHLLGVRFSYFVADAIGNALQHPPWHGGEAYLFAIPFGALALITVLLYGRNVAWVVSLSFCLLVGRVGGAEASWPLMIYSLASSLAAIYALDALQFKQRTVTSQAGVVVGLVNVVTVLALTSLDGEMPGLARLGVIALCAFIGGLLTAAITSFSVPILEALLSVTTHIKLIELANPNLPLLRRLALEAPGSFQHSLAVANLAKAGCEAIAADAVLVNTCALYHDVGKIVRPQYFIENQIPGQNPHDKVQPTMSALILINHVKEGRELAERYRLPQPLVDGIEQHHGTRLIKFFFRRAQERDSVDAGSVREDDFRYPGPKPKRKETGVLMLADAAEAASRTLVEPSQQKIRTMLRQIFDDCLRDQQLDQTDLTLGDLRKVEDAFLHVLTNIFHRRVDYPGFDFNQPRRKRSSSSTSSMPAVASGTDRKAS